jgi:hypothetical protein
MTINSIDIALTQPITYTTFYRIRIINLKYLSVGPNAILNIINTLDDTQ